MHQARFINFLPLFMPQEVLMLNIDWSRLLFSFPAIIIALTFHEFSHGFIAYKFGDPTAKNAGRLTLNPIKHLDPLGTFMLLFLRFGWAKPVPVNPYYFSGDRRSKMALVAIAGPTSNIILAVISAISMVAMASFAAPTTINIYFYNLLDQMVFINIILAVFNLLPLPPLDGSKILGGFLPGHLEEKYYQIERYGYLILMVLIISGVLSRILTPMVIGMYTLIINFAKLMPFA